MGHYSVTDVCPKCGQSYKGRPALCQDDGKNLICPDCGVREALDNTGSRRRVTGIHFECHPLRKAPFTI